MSTEPWDFEHEQQRSRQDPDYEDKHQHCATAGGACIAHFEAPLCVLDESNDMEAFAALPDCPACEGTGKDVPDDFWGPAQGGDTTP